MKKKFLSIVALGILAGSLCACGADNAQEATETTTEAATEAVDAAEDENNQIVYMGGLYAADGESDINLALFKSSGTPVVIIQEGSNIYYGEFITEDATLEDGREYVKITVEDKVYGYHFNDDMTGFVVDQDGKAHDAKELDESVAMDMQKETEGTADASEDASGSVAGEYVSADEEGGFVILKDDNTGSLNFQDVIDITWDGDAYKITEKESGNSYPYTIDGDELTLDYDGNKLVFTKK